MCKSTYLLGRDHDSDLLDGLGELIGLDGAVSVQVEVLEGFLEDLLLRGDARRLLLQLVLQLFLETTGMKSMRIRYCFIYRTAYESLLSSLPQRQ